MSANDPKTTERARRWANTSRRAPRLDARPPHEGKVAGEVIASRAMRGLGLVATLALAACGGSIEFGVDRADSGVVVSPPDARPADLDAGVSTSSDAGGLSPDAMVPCTPRTRPAIPTAWPYPATKAAYVSHFHAAVPSVATCGASVACHALNGSEPYIPLNPDDLDDPTRLQTALSQLWARAQPPAAGATPVLRARHDPAGGRAPPYSGAQMAALDTFLARSHDCAWKAAPAPGPGECPAPDVSYCDQ